MTLDGREDRDMQDNNEAGASPVPAGDELDQAARRLYSALGIAASDDDLTVGAADLRVVLMELHHGGAEITELNRLVARLRSMLDVTIQFALDPKR